MSLEFEYRTRTKLHTVRLGELLGQAAGPGDVVVLSGPLGSGKTVFVRGMAQGLGADGSQVHSPTFTLMHTYPGRLPFYHFDLYRLDSSDELARLGFDEYLFDGEGVSAVEWGDKFADMMPEQALWVSFSTPEEPGQRCIRFSAEDPKARRVLERVKHGVQEIEGGSV